MIDLEGRVGLEECYSVEFEEYAYQYWQNRDIYEKAYKGKNNP